MPETLIVASSSSARRLILERAGVPFVAEASGLDEDEWKARLAERPVEEVAEALAEAKAMRVCARHPGALVLGADQILDCDGARFDKPADKAAAARQLRLLRGRRHRLVNGLVLARNGHAVWRHREIATLWMRDFSDAFLERYLAEAGPEVLESVGAYRLEGPGAQLFERIEGDFFAVLGLPLLALLGALRREGLVPR
ncbi:MAG: Maf family nucleotide pyrophosphatase [Pseudomonadota bacterium]